MNSDLNLGEPHPSARAALTWVVKAGPVQHTIWQESLASCALSGNRMAEICSETLRRVMYAEPVSDRYILGLAYMLLTMQLKGLVDDLQASDEGCSDDLTVVSKSTLDKLVKTIEAS